MTQIVAIIGVGYVGLHSALTLSNAGIKVIAFDINQQRINELACGIDQNMEITDVHTKNINFTHDPEQLKEANYYLISVPTPINSHKVPDLHPLKTASKLVASVLKKGDLVILESTVFPGATRELLIPILNKNSGLISGTDFLVGYTSERIVPGDKRLTQLTTSVRVISGQNEEALRKIEQLYQLIPEIKVHSAPSLEIAESSKLLENIQRSVNISLMNEFAQIMDKLNIPFHDVLAAAKTKSNFHPYTPGLVGGHCIPEDPYYLIHQASTSDCIHNLISCACQTNQQFYYFIMNKLTTLLIKQKIVVSDAKIAILGMSFKANVNDIRHSLSINLYDNLKSMGINALACDPLVIHEKIDMDWIDLEELEQCDAIVLCQAHEEFIQFGVQKISDKLVTNGVFIDIPGVYAHSSGLRKDILYWGL
ncbi:nucleotide sugar dehydrogenase [Legionella rowbothamii]|uniref:nucleotide sugar dehydrogenase n=1 Tax=Legionella rowbothamii TaxID=96229 RepID=UPI00105424FD|nr:nucleotide sugar dehydrogenase [Legionella rowbothamii]